MSEPLLPTMRPVRLKPFRFAIVRAGDYVRHPNPYYAGNPFIECLEQFVDLEFLADRLERLPLWSESQRQLSPVHRGQLASSLRRLVIALPRLVELARACIDLIMEGYCGREPFLPRHNALLQARYSTRVARLKLKDAARVAAVEASLAKAEASNDDSSRLENSGALRELMTAFIGSSGSGKTTALERVANLYPDVLYHEEHGIWQIPVLIIRFPPDGRSLHALATAIIEEIDRRLPDCGYKAEYIHKRRGNATERLGPAYDLLHIHAVGLVLFDDSQDQKNAEPRRKRERRIQTAGPQDEPSTITPEMEAPLISLLLAASQKFGVPIVLVGTNELTDVLEGRFSTSRRGSGYSMQQWGLLEMSGSLKEPAEFELLLMSLWGYQLLLEDVPLTPDMVRLFADLTQGISDMVVKLYIATIRQALKDGLESFDEALVSKTFEEEFKTVHRALEALRTNDPSKLVRYPDIAPTDLRTGARYEQAAVRMHLQNVQRKGRRPTA